MTFPKAGTPCFRIDTAKTSSLEQATTTVYATGGRGNTRLLSWEGEKTVTFTLEDALISPMGLGVLTGAGLVKGTAAKPKHVHVALTKKFTRNDTKAESAISVKDINDALGLNETSYKICLDEYTPIYGSNINGTDFIFGVDSENTAEGDVRVYIGGDGVSIANNIATITTPSTTGSPKLVIQKCSSVSGSTRTWGGNTADYAGKTYDIDFYVVIDTSEVQEIEIKPDSFGGYFYLEAQTLFRREDNGKDMATEIIMPKVKVQSGFTFSMASSGDPSTFTFTMDVLPGYTSFDNTQKVMCIMQSLTGEAESADVQSHVSNITHTADAQG